MSADPPRRPPLTFARRAAAPVEEEETAALPAPAPPPDDTVIVVQGGRVSRGGLVSLHALDPGLNGGLGIFETMRVRRGRVIALDRHLDRLAAGARALGLGRLPHAQQLQIDLSLAQTTLGLYEAVLRVALTAGGATWVRATPAPDPKAALRAVTAPDPCLHLAGIKHMSRAVGLAALASARSASGAPVDELIWRAPAGGLLEGTWSNVIGVKDGVIITAPLDGRVLPGVTRARALEAAAALGLPVREAPPPEAGLDELWCSSAVQGLVPVVVLDGVPAAGPGPLGRALAASLDAADDLAPAR